VANAESVKGLQDEGVIACAKHFVGNEREFTRPVRDFAMEELDINSRYA
jgi:beta-glucosidase-like glycosyl hydrolase